MSATWLLEVDAYGRTLRYAEGPEVLTDRNGTSYVFEAGLIGDLELAAGDESVVVELLVGADATPSDVALELEGARARLLRWTPGDRYELARVFLVGRVVGTQYGATREPISFELTVEDVVPNDVVIPHVQAVVDETTWPVSATATTPASQLGIRYPEIFGLPGYTGAATPTPVVPVPLAEFRDAFAASTHVVVSARSIPATRAYLQDYGRDDKPANWQTAADFTDKLGRRTRACDFALNTSLMPVAANVDSTQFYAGFHATYGGGLNRSAYDVITWLLRNFCGAMPIDWARLPEVELLLDAYLVDHWLNEPLAAWEYINGTLLPLLPVVVRLGRDGYYLERQRYTATGRDAVGSISADRRECDRRGPVSLVGVDALVNEVTVEFRPLVSGEWGARRTLTAQAGKLSGAAPAEVTTSTTDSRILGNPLAAASQARYGVRAGELVEIPWCWDAATALQIAQDVLERRAFPFRSVVYGVRDGEDLKPADVLLLSDSEVGFADVPAIVAEPPLVGPDGVAVTFRIPVSG